MKLDVTNRAHNASAATCLGSVVWCPSADHLDGYRRVAQLRPADAGARCAGPFPRSADLRTNEKPLLGEPVDRVPLQSEVQRRPDRPLTIRGRVVGAVLVAAVRNSSAGTAVAVALCYFYGDEQTKTALARRGAECGDAWCRHRWCWCPVAGYSTRTARLS